MRKSVEPLLAESLGGAFAFHDDEFVARIRQTGEAEHFRRRGRAGAL